MSVFFRFNRDGTVSVAKKMFGGTIKKSEFDEKCVVISSEKFLAKYKSEEKAKLEEELKIIEEFKKSSMNVDGFEEIGPMIMRNIDGTYYIDKFVVRDRDFVVAKSADKDVENLENVKREIMEYGISLYGEAFAEIVEKKDLLNFNAVVARNLGCSVEGREGEIVYFKDGKLLSDEQQKKLRVMKVEQVEKVMELSRKVEKYTSEIRDAAKPYKTRKI